jgi:hypothetical protein
VLKIHTRDGQTIRVDLEEPSEAQPWLRRLRDPDFQEEITGLTLSHRGVSYSVPRPKGFPSIVFGAELVAPTADRRVKGGELLVCHAGDVRTSIMVHREQRAARIMLFRLGRQRYNPVAGGQ